MERCQGAGCTNFTQIATVAGTATTYEDTSVTATTTYSYRIRATDAAGNTSAYSNTTTATTPTAAATATGPGPLHADPTGRYLVNQNGTPILITGDSPQGLIVNSGNISGNRSTDATNYFVTRKSEGFNAVWINLLCDTYTGGRSDGSTEDGIRPFTTGTSPNDYDDDTPNSAYFARVDQLLQIADQYGIADHRVPQLDGHRQLVVHRPTWRSRIDLDGTYTYPPTPTYDTTLTDYNRTDHIPILLQEAYYENEHGISEHDLRARSIGRFCPARTWDSSTGSTTRASSFPAGTTISRLRTRRMPRR